MSGRGSGRRGKGGRGGAKRSRDNFERKTPSNSQSAEAAAPLPGGFKSMKAKWISFYENEKKAQESAPSVQPQSAADTEKKEHTAAVPLEATLPSSASNRLADKMRKQYPPEAVKKPDKEDINSSSREARRCKESVTEQKADSVQQPDQLAVPRIGVPDPKAQEQPTAALNAPTPPAPLTNPAEGAAGQAAAKAEEDSRVHNQVVEGVSVAQQASTAAPAGRSRPEVFFEQPAAAEPARGTAASGLGPGRVAAMQDAAASYKAASKAHSSMQEALSPKRAEATGRVSAMKAGAADSSKATNAEAKLAVSEPSRPSTNATAPPQNLPQGQPAAVEKSDEAFEGPLSAVKLSNDPALRGAASQGATAGQLRENNQDGSSSPDRGQQPKPEIKQEAKEPAESAAAPMRKVVAKEQKKPGVKDKAVGKLGSEVGPRQPKQKLQKGQAEWPQGPATGTKQSADTALKQPCQSGPGPDGKKAGQPGPNGQKAGQRAHRKAQLDSTSRQETRKALSQAKEAAGGRAAKAQEDSKAEDRIEGWKLQLREMQSAGNDASAPDQPAPGPTPNGGEEASRQKGSDASSLEHSPDIPHPEQQQQHERAETAVAPEDREQHALAKAKAVSALAANSQPSQLAPVEYLGDGSSPSQQLGQIDLNQYDSYRALWAGLREDYGQSLPEGLHLRLVYEDGDGDFVMLQPEEPWAAFLSSARRVIISCQ